MISKSAMESELNKFYNGEAPYLFSGIPTESDVMEKAALLWKNIFKNGFSGVVPASSNVDTAADTLYATLNTPQLLAPDGGAKFYGAVAVFYGSLGTGMTGFTFAPPPPLVLSASTEDPEEAADLISSQILSNGQLGTATNIVSGVTSNWL